MSSLLVLLVLGAALLHAVWNTLVKAGGEPEFTIASFQLVGALACLMLVPFVAPPARGSWPMLLASVAVHNVYYLTLARAYRIGDLGQVYPLFRGLAPVLVAVGGFLFAGEWLGPVKLAGICTVSAGVMSLALPRGTGNRFPAPAVLWGLATSLMIACYTVVDGIGVRAAGSRIGYILWLFVFEIVPIGTVLLITRKRAFSLYLRTRWRSCLIGGLASSAAYGMVVFAMSLGAMAVVSSLRETSVVFSVLIATFVLKEPFGRHRTAASLLVAGGVILMQLA